jgi:hypothetical protein
LNELPSVPLIECEQLGRRKVKRLHSAARDDANDTRLFDALQDYVIEHYPNPSRVGCLNQELLRCLVETPEQLDLSDSKFLHVFKCGECTCQLRDLRRNREAGIQRDR